MTRAFLQYDAQHAAVHIDGFDPDSPIAGHYEMKMVRGGMICGIRIWNGPPHDPVTGEELDRSWRWQAEVNGDRVEIERVWPKCGPAPISPERYAEYVARARHAQDFDPLTPQANPRRQIDFLRDPIAI